MSKHPSHDAALDCREAEALLDPFLDGELDAARLATLETHLEGCESCGDELALARRIRSELHELPGLSCPPPVTRAVFEHAEAHPTLGERLRRLGFGHRVWQPVFAALVAVVLGVGYWRLATPPPPPGSQSAYTAEEIAQAEAELKLALAYLGDIGEKARDQLSAEVSDRVVGPFTRSIAGALLPAGKAEPAGSGEDGD